MKKILSLLLAGTLSMSLLAGCGSSTPKPDAGTTGGATDGVAEGEKIQVYQFIKNRGDLSYWDSMAEGGDRAKIDFAGKADIYVTETTEDIQANLTAMYEAADAGADLIMSAGDFKDNLLEISEAYPDIAIVMMGENVEGTTGNVYGFDFQTSEASFLAGIAAADVASQGLEDTSGSKVVGFIGGMDESIVIQEFFLGYIQGAKYYDGETKVVYNYVGAWNDPDTARTQALTQFNDSKADVIFACAGGSGNGVHTAAAEAKKYVFGVDSDQSLMYKEDESIKSRFITSVLKLNGNAVYGTIEKFIDEGTLPYGTYEILGLEADAVGLVENEQFTSRVSEKGMEMIQQAIAGIKDGSIKVDGAVGKDQVEIKSLIDKHVNAK